MININEAHDLFKLLDVMTSRHRNDLEGFRMMADDINGLRANGTRDA